MSKGQVPRLHGAIVNVPVDANKTFSFYLVLRILLWLN